MVYETVVFDKEGGVRLLTLLDFRDAPSARLRVRQFDLPQLDCATIGMVLFNGVETCLAETPDTCEAATRLTTRTSVEVRQ